MQSQNTVIYSKHPLLPEAGRVTHTAVHVPNETVAQLLERCGISVLSSRNPVVVQVNGRSLSRIDLYTTVVGADDLITVRQGVEGGKGSQILAIIALIALTVFTYGAASPYTLAGITGLTGTALVAAQAVVMVAGNLLISQLFKPKIPKADPADTSPTYSLSGGSNQMRPYAPMPIVFGRSRMFADAGSKPYVFYEGDDQILEQMFNFGLSDITLSELKIGDTPIENFNDCLYQITNGDNGPQRDPWKQTLVRSNVDTVEGGGALKYNVTVTSTTSVDTVGIGIDIVGNLFRVSDKGNYKDEDAVLGIDFRKVGTDTWYPFTAVTPWTETENVRYGKGYKEVTVQSVVGYRIRNASPRAVRQSLYRAVEQGQYEVRVKKLNFDIPGQNEPGYDGDKHKNRTADLSWSALRSYQPDEADYTGQTRVGVSIRASGQLSGAIDRLNAIASAKTLVWSGGVWSLQETSNPAWWYLHFARGKKDADGRKMYGACLPDDRIDIAKIVEWASWCEAKDLEFNWILDVDMSVDDVLSTIARVGRGIPTLATGKLGVIYDKAEQPVTQMFGMANIKAGTFEVNYVSENLADEVVVEFINPELGWQRDEVRALVPGVTNPLKSVSYLIAGITDKDQAGREATLQAAAQVLFRKRVSFETDIEGLVCIKGDKIQVSHDLTSWSASGRLEAGSTATVLHLSREVVFGPTESTPFVCIRYPDNTMVMRAVVPQAEGTTTTTITLSSPLPSSPSADADNAPQDYLFQFDPLATPGKAFKITSIEPLSENHCRIGAREESEAYYEAEGGAYVYVVPTLYNQNAPSISNIVVTEQLIDPTEDTVQVHVTWNLSGAESTLVRVAPPGGQYINLGVVSANSISFLWYERETITIELTPQSVVRLKSAPGTTVVQYKIAGTESLPEDVAAKVPDVNGLMLFGDTAQTMQFVGSDAKFTWRKVASGAAELGSELQGGDSGSGDKWFRDYEVKVLNPDNSVRRTEHVQDESYTYTYEKNFEDGSGTPTRSFKVEVRVRGTQGQFSSRPARIAVSNPAPATPTGINTTSAFSTVAISYGLPSDTDFAGVQVWMATETGFTPATENLVADTNTNTVVIGDLTPGQTYYFRLAAYDKFGKSGLNVSSEFSITTYKVQVEDLSPEVIALLTTGDADIAEELEDLNSAITSEIAARVAAVTAEAAARVAADNSEATTRAAAITTEATTRATADSALSSSITTLGTTVSGHTAAIASEVSTRSSADAALATDISTLNTTVGGHTSSISTISGSLSTLSGTVATHTTTLSSHSTDISGLNSTTATHTSQISTITSNVSSLSSSLSALSSTVGSNTAAISSEASTRASADSALSSSISTLSTTVSGNTASITTQASSINGIEAKYAVKVDVNGKVAGFGLISTANNGTPTSIFAVAADKFAIFDGSSDISPFTVSGGVVYMSNAVATNFAAGSITADKLNVSTISAIATSTGSLNVTGDVTVGTSGVIRSGKSSYGSGTGYLWEYNGGTPRFDIGNADAYMRWNGSGFEVKGTLQNYKPVYEAPFGSVLGYTSGSGGSGFSAAQQGMLRCYIVGDLCFVVFDFYRNGEGAYGGYSNGVAYYGTGNGTQFAINTNTGMPKPQADVEIGISLMDGGAMTPSFLTVERSTGYIRGYRMGASSTYVTRVNTGFTASGNKGIPYGTTLVYRWYSYYDGSNVIYA